MIQPILLVTHPIHLDYPLFRYNVKRYQKYFSSVWIALTDHHQNIDYTNFLQKELPGSYFVQVRHEGSDWRNDAINETLDRIGSDEPICFMEQDFFIKDESFFEQVFATNYRFLYFTEGDRIHPAFAVVSRKLIEETDRDFSAYPPQGDHFAHFFDQLTTGIHIDELGVKNKEDYYHLNGLSQNYASFKNDQPFYRPDDFLYYNSRCIRLPVENHPQFFQIEKAIETKYGQVETHPFLGQFFA